MKIDGSREAPNVRRERQGIKETTDGKRSSRVEEMGVTGRREGWAGFLAYPPAATIWKTQGRACTPIVLLAQHSSVP